MLKQSHEELCAFPDRVDAVVVGAGFAGLYMIYRLRELGLSVQGFEKGTDVGGVWYWNRYPGARCDIESMQYSYSFSPELQQSWTWKETFASQPEILSYANHVADRFDLRQHIGFNTQVLSAVYDEADGRWEVVTDTGQRLSARFCIMATGCLSVARTPEVPGMRDFSGKIYHTAHWPHDDVDLVGQHVGVIGTGSSGIQLIPVIAEEAGRVTVFQRTANFSVPSCNRPMEPDYEQSWKDNYDERRRLARDTPMGILRPLEINSKSALDASEDERQRVYEAYWQAAGTGFTAAFPDVMKNEAANRTAADFVRAKIHSMVDDPRTADSLLPKDHPLGSKRICVDNRYYETFNKASVELVDLKVSPIIRITRDGVETQGRHHRLDAIIFATGFDAMTGALNRIDIVARNGQSLRDKWADGPKTYLGLMTAGFPNLFMITGPGSPSVLSNMILSIEQHVDWITACITHLREHGLTTIEASQKAEEEWVGHVNDLADATLYKQAKSWFTGANIPGKPEVFMPYPGGVPAYRGACDAVASNGYDGFVTCTLEESAGGERMTGTE